MSAISPSESPPASFSNYDADEDPNLLIRRILALVRVSVSARLSDINGLTESQWRPLHWLYTRGPLRVIELAHFCEIDPAGMTRLIDRLERKGLCRRSRSPSDRRVVEVFLTDGGLDSARRVTPVLERIQAELLTGFDKEQQENLLRLLARLANNARVSGQALTQPQRLIIES